MYNREIKPSTSTQFPIGSKVKITNSGQCYSGYRDMARHMGLDNEWSNDRNPFRNGDVGVVVAKAQHEYQDSGDVLAVRVENGLGLMSVKGVVEYEEPLPAIDWKDMQVGYTVRFTDLGQGHGHWQYELNKDYVVGVNEYGNIGPKNPTGHIPSRNWAGWQLVVLPQPEPTVEELKAELAAVKAKLWEAEWKLNKITSVIEDGIL